MSRVKNHVVDRLVAGMFLLLPIVVSWWILKFVFDRVDGILQPLTSELVGRELPGGGLALTIIIVYLFGLLAVHGIGKKIVGLMQDALLAIPVVKTVYALARKIVESFDPSGTAGNGFKKVVAVEYPRKGSLSLGFQTTTVRIEGKRYIVVYFPSPPSPQSGNLALFPEEDVKETSLSVGEFMQGLFSLGLNLSPNISYVSRTSPEDEKT